MLFFLKPSESSQDDSEIPLSQDRANNLSLAEEVLQYFKVEDSEKDKNNG
jgi:hypothetical protein